MANINVFDKTQYDGSRLGDELKDVADHVSAVDITGTTSATVGTATAFAHGLSYTPSGAVVLSGNAYVTSVDATNVNVASGAASQNFRVRVVK